jgi:hypothetical protein
MREEILICLAILAAGLRTSVGQVSYATLSIAPGYNLLSNPFSAGVTNGANEIMVPLDGEQIITWEGRGFVLIVYDSAFGGWIDENYSRSFPPSLPPGQGFILFNPGIVTTNITFTGRIVLSPGTTNYVNLPSGYSLVGSLLPVSVTNFTSAPVNLPIIDGMQILTWTNGGYAYDYASYDSGFGGWVGKDFSLRPAPSYSIGQGFFFFNPGAATNWEQSLP